MPIPSEPRLAPLKPLVVLIPVFNDWDAAEIVVRQLSQVLSQQAIPLKVLLVNDGSTIPKPVDFLAGVSPQVDGVVVNLRRNLGHQRAIAIALAYVQENIAFRAVVVMDGDGEDDPKDVLFLLKKFAQEKETTIVFAARSKRTENLLFRLFYQIYRGIHLALTGINVQVGNFSILPPGAVDRLVAVSELWNHYAAAVFKARLPKSSILLPRAHRVCGQSKMNFISLVVHGLSAISVFSDIVGVRLLAVTTLLMIGCLLMVAAVVYVKFWTALAIPGWATNAVGMSLVLMFQAIIMSAFFIFITLNGRQNAGYLPIRDYRFFVLAVEPLP